jgi:ABC-type glutathione transport system ATPase component
MSCDARVPALLDVDGFVVRRRSGWSVRIPHLRLQAGQVVALHGASGVGKSTALAGLFGLLEGRDVAVDGTVRWRGDEWRELVGPSQRRALRQEIAFLTQDAAAALDPLAPIGLQIAQATGCSAAQIAAMLDELGVAHSSELCRRLPHQVSGGEAQRALLAIAFLRAPALVVADEPSASLDAQAQAALRSQLQALVQRGCGLLLATHDHRLVHDLSASVLVASGDAFVPGVVDPAPWPEHGREPDVGTVPLLAAEGLRVSFAGRVVLDGVDLAVHRGEVVALVGVSGTGKTTLARVLAGHRRPDAGVVRRPGRARAVQLVPQDAFASLTPRRSLASLLEETAVGHDAELLAARLQLGPALARQAWQLSGGERRRAALLRALTVRPDVLVLDEPTASLDRQTAVAVMRSVLDLQRDRGMGIVLITHDLELARAVAHRVCRIDGGRLCEG